MMPCSLLRLIYITQVLSLELSTIPSWLLPELLNLIGRRRNAKIANANHYRKYAL
jgi:hypothetical protein